MLAKARAEFPIVDVGEPFGELRLVQEIDVAQAEPGAEFVEAPSGASVVQEILGKPARVLPNEGGPSYFAYRVGEGLGLKPGGAYVLEIEYPEDQPRTMFISSRGSETIRGLSTGKAFGDVLYTYTNNNVESLDIPLSGEYRHWRMLFFLHDRFPGIEQHRGAGLRSMRPNEGFWVVISQADSKSDPASAGAAVSRIRLYEVESFDKLILPLRLPPPELPRRYITWREEMADGVVHDNFYLYRGLEDPVDWYEYKVRLMQFLGMDTFGKDLLEFGHNQGWDVRPYGGSSWYVESAYPDRWAKILDMIARYPGISVLPYYEWAGGTGTRGIGKAQNARSLAGEVAYTHVTWSERFNVDITDPAALEEAKKLLDATILRFADRTEFVGAWFRTRPSHLPISFADATIERFVSERHMEQPVTREQLREDPELLEAYYDWWFAKRKEFLEALRDHLREGGVEDAALLFTAVHSEPAPSLPGSRIVTDDVAWWRSRLDELGVSDRNPVSFDEVVEEGRHLTALTSPVATWGQWEWQHSAPHSDPERYKEADGVYLTYAFQNLYTVSDPDAFEVFRTASGLAATRHYPLNEDTMHEDLGYFVSDVDRAGPYSMLPEARLMAYGDPRFLTYLSAASYNRAFPEYVRKFNAAFLALPALPSEILPEAGSHEDVVVRKIDAGAHGTYLAIVNVGLHTVENATVTLPAQGETIDAATGAALDVRGSAVTMSLYPGELRALHILPADQ